MLCFAFSFIFSGWLYKCYCDADYCTRNDNHVNCVQQKHLLPMDEAEMLFSQGWVTHGRPRYTYGRGRPRSKKLWDFEVSDNEAETYVPKASSGAGRMVNPDRLLQPNYNGKVFQSLKHYHLFLLALACLLVFFLVDFRLTFILKFQTVI